MPLTIPRAGVEHDAMRVSSVGRLVFTRATCACVALALTVGCGGGKPEPATPEAGAETAAPAESDEPAGPAKDSSDEQASKPAEDAPLTMPTKCAKTIDGVCLPNQKFVEKLCNSAYPNIALVMHAKGSPWTRGYLRGKTKAWNASGGASSGDEVLEFDEEVVVVRYRKASTKGIQVSGAGSSYDALRWDGSCVTLSDGEMTLKRPPRQRASKITWKWLDGTMREALRESPEVDAAYKARRKECKGVSMGEVSLKCVKLDQKLSDVIVKHVRNGGKVGVPEQMPE